MLESIFQIDYHFPQEDITFRKTPLGSYMPFQMEYDDMNEFGSRTYYLTAMIEGTQFRKAVFVRLALKQLKNYLFLDLNEPYKGFLHTCRVVIDNPDCSFLFKKAGYYDGCSCGDKVEKM